MPTKEEIQKSIAKSKEKYTKLRKEAKEKAKEERELLKYLKDNTLMIEEITFDGIKESRLVTVAFRKPYIDANTGEQYIEFYITVMNPKDSYSKREAKLSLARKISEEIATSNVILAKECTSRHIMLYAAKLEIILTALSDDSTLPRSFRKFIIESIHLF